MGNGLALEMSHGKPRSTVRVDELPPLPSEETAPMQDAKTGRFLPGNRAHRRRQLKARAEGISTLNPATVPSWMRPHVETGMPYTRALLGMLQERPALFPLAGDCSDAHVMYRALLALALDVEPKERAVLLSEARGWLREHRSSLATLSALAGGMKLPEPDAVQTFAAIAAAEEAKTRGRHP